MKWLKRILVAALAGLLLWQAWDRLFVTESKRVKRAIARMEQAVEENNLLALSDLVAASYSDGHGLDKSTLLASIRATRLQFSSLLIHISDLHLELATNEPTAQATLIAKVLTSRAGGGQTEINAERVRLFLRKTDGAWKLTRIESPELKFE